MKQIMKDNVSFNIRKDRLFKSTVVFFSLLSLVPLFLILGFIFIKGLPVAFNFHFLTHEQYLPMGVGFKTLEGMARVKAIGGIAHGIIGTLMITLTASLIAIPLGLIVGIYLAENRGKKLVDYATIAVDMIQGIPSIIFGIVVNVWIVRTFKGFSGLAGGIALALMMLPLIIKNTEETLKLIPSSLKEAAYALGAPYYKVVLNIMLPVGLSGIMTGILVAVARVMGETAPLLFTSFGNRYINWNIGEQMETLPTMIYKFSMSPYANWVENAWGASAVLVIFVLLLNIITKVVVNKWKVKF